MSEKAQIIAFVPARAGSKSIPLKNIKLFAGKPLIEWVLTALQNSSVDKIVLSTDGDQIAEIANDLQLSKLEIYHRDASTATDEATTESAMLDYLANNPHASNDIFILVQATSPWTTADNIDQALHVYNQEALDSLLSVVENHCFLWDANGKSINYDYQNRSRRQDMSRQYQENGAFYMNRVSNISRDKNRLSGVIGYYLMPKHTAIELDDLEDWRLAELIFSELNS